MIVPGMEHKKNPWRYPFADVFLYSYDERYDIWAYNNQWRKLIPGTGFNATLKWPNGTTLTSFGDFEMRISMFHEQYLQTQYKSNWRDVGVTQWYGHYNLGVKETTEFEIPQNLYCPAKPFSLPWYLTGFTCQKLRLGET